MDGLNFKTGQAIFIPIDLVDANGNAFDYSKIYATLTIKKNSDRSLDNSRALATMVLKDEYDPMTKANVKAFKSVNYIPEGTYKYDIKFVFLDTNEVIFSDTFSLIIQPNVSS